MQLDHRPTKILVAGNSGCGKSTFATRYVLNAPQRVKFIFDPEGEFALRNGFSAAGTAEELFSQLESGWVIFDAGQEFEGATAEAFEFFSEWVFRISKALDEEAEAAGQAPMTKLFFADELQTVVETHEVPAGLRLILETGRRYGIDTLLVTQQPNVIHNRARNQITEVVAFSQVDENAVQFLVALGFDGDEIRGLPPGEFRLLQIRTRTWQAGNVFTGERRSYSPGTGTGLDTRPAEAKGGCPDTTPAIKTPPEGVQAPSSKGKSVANPENPVSPALDHG